MSFLLQLTPCPLLASKNHIQQFLRQLIVVAGLLRYSRIQPTVHDCNRRLSLAEIGDQAVIFTRAQAEDDLVVDGNERPGAVGPLVVVVSAGSMAC